MARKRARGWGQSSSDSDVVEPQPTSPAKAARWSNNYDDDEWARSRRTAPASGSQSWLAAESESSSDDIWRRRRNCLRVAPKTSAAPKTIAPRKRPWTQCSSSSDNDGNCPFQVSSSSDSEGSSGVPETRSSGVPEKAEHHGKPAVDLNLGVVQLKSQAFAVRDKLTANEEWGYNAKRLRSVTTGAACKCKRQCYKQVPMEELSLLCMWYHGHMTYAERQYVIQTLYFDACKEASGVTVFDQCEDNDRVRHCVQWRLQGSPGKHK